ncbi:phenol hydroxylase subunit P4 [Aliarcobacter lanthieri]|uniref:phenol hydroxylase subunit P4 n=1 Tax=Aliarcobacter lanthieri TaxID=1355374 RepID=UPI003AAB903D
MAIQSIGEYPIIIRDDVKNFHGNQVVYLYWYGHRVVSSPRAFPLSPDMLFSSIVSDLIPLTYNIEPDYENLDFNKIEIIWEIDGKIITPDFSKTLKENGVGHKSFIIFRTPSLIGKVGA